MVLLEDYDKQRSFDRFPHKILPWILYSPPKAHIASHHVLQTPLLDARSQDQQKLQNPLRVPDSEPPMSETRMRLFTRHPLGPEVAESARPEQNMQVGRELLAPSRRKLLLLPSARAWKDSTSLGFMWSRVDRELRRGLPRC